MTIMIEKEVDVAREIKKILPVTQIKKMSEEESLEILSKKKAGSYFFRKDENGNVYLSGKDMKGELHHARVNKDQEWIVLNGGNYKMKHLEDLICLYMHCERDEVNQLCIANEI